MLHPSFLFALGIAVVGCAPEARADSPSIGQAGEQLLDKTANEERVVIPVEGMGCESCAERLQARLAGLEGVSKAVVDFSRAEARVTFDPGEIGVPRIVAEIDELFEAGTPRKDDRR